MLQKHLQSNIHEQTSNRKTDSCSNNRRVDVNRVSYPLSFPNAFSATCIYLLYVSICNSIKAQ